MPDRNGRPSLPAKKASGTPSMVDRFRRGAAFRLRELSLAAGVREMNKALTGSGGEAIVKLLIVEALQDKRIMLLHVSEGGMNLKTMNLNQLIEMMGVSALASQEGKKQGARPSYSPWNPAREEERHYEGKSGENAPGRFDSRCYGALRVGRECR